MVQIATPTTLQHQAARRTHVAVDTKLVHMETVDAATGQLAPQKAGKRKRKRQEADEVPEDGNDLRVAERSPKRKVLWLKVKCASFGTHMDFTHNFIGQKVAKQAKSIGVLCERSHFQVDYAISGS